MVYFDENGEVFDGKTFPGFKEHNMAHKTEQYVLKRQYCYATSNGYNLKRTINKFFNASGDLCRYYIVTYKVTDELGQPSNATFVKFSGLHGNAKKSTDIFYRTKPSVINAIGKLGEKLAPKEIISAVEKESGGCYSSTSKSDLVRDRTQVYNKLRFIQERRKARNTGKIKITDYSKVLSMLNENDFVKDVSFHTRNKDGKNINDMYSEERFHSFCWHFHAYNSLQNTRRHYKIIYIAK